MKVISIKHNADILVGDYPYADSVNEEAVSLLKDCEDYHNRESNVKATLTYQDWEPDNIKFRNLKSFILYQIKNYLCPIALKYSNFWANVYEKGDFAKSHDHIPCLFSFVYFVKSKWYYSPLVFSDGNRVRPKEGRYVIFPGYLKHYVPQHRYSNNRITISGNFRTTLP